MLTRTHAEAVLTLTDQFNGNLLQLFNKVNFFLLLLLLQHFRTFLIIFSFQLCFYLLFSLHFSVSSSLLLESFFIITIIIVISNWIIFIIIVTILISDLGTFFLSFFLSFSFSFFFFFFSSWGEKLMKIHIFFQLSFYVATVVREEYCTVLYCTVLALISTCVHFLFESIYRSKRRMRCTSLAACPCSAWYLLRLLHLPCPRHHQIFPPPSPPLLPLLRLVSLLLLLLLLQFPPFPLSPLYHVVGQLFVTGVRVIKIRKHFIPFLSKIWKKRKTLDLCFLENWNFHVWNQM